MIERYRISPRPCHAGRRACQGQTAPSGPPPLSWPVTRAPVY